MKAVVTGGAGFIGSHLCELLLQQGCSVTAVDNFETGRESNLAPFRDHARFSLVNHDICEPDGLAVSFRDADWVFHLAGLADIVPSIEKPDRYFACNVRGTLNVLQLARDAGVKRFVYAASSSCYGIPDIFPTPETAEIRPQYPYALTKRMGEELVMHWARVYQLPALSLRLFNVYGPRSRTTGAYGAVFGVFLAQKLNGKPYTVVGDGEQTRDFTFVTDVARAFIAAAESERVERIYNVGSGNHYSINRLVSLLEGPVSYIPKRPGEPDCTFADTRRIRSELAWAPAVSFEDGVAQMLAAIQNWAGAPVWDAEGIKAATASWFRHLGAKS